MAKTWLQHGPNFAKHGPRLSIMAQTLPQHGPNMAPVIQHSVGLSQDFSQIFKHFKQVEAKIQ